MASTLIGERVILCVIFDKKSTLGLVRLRTKRAVKELGPVFDGLFERLGLTPPAEVPATSLDIDPDSAFRLEASRRVDELLGGMFDGPTIQD
jgi:hypothetical protein